MTARDTYRILAAGNATPPTRQCSTGWWKPPLVPVVKVERHGRNEPCPCGSGKKWKRCCGAR